MVAGLSLGVVTRMGGTCPQFLVKAEGAPQDILSLLRGGNLVFSVEGFRLLERKGPIHILQNLSFGKCIYYQLMTVSLDRQWNYLGFTKAVSSGTVTLFAFGMLILSN